MVSRVPGLPADEAFEMIKWIVRRAVDGSGSSPLEEILLSGFIQQQLGVFDYERAIVSSAVLSTASILYFAGLYAGIFFMSFVLFFNKKRIESVTAEFSDTVRRYNALIEEGNRFKISNYSLSCDINDLKEEINKNRKKLQELMNEEYVDKQQVGWRKEIPEPGFLIKPEEPKIIQEPELLRFYDDKEDLCIRIFPKAIFIVGSATLFFLFLWLWGLLNSVYPTGYAISMLFFAGIVSCGGFILGSWSFKKLDKQPRVKPAADKSADNLNDREKGNDETSDAAGSSPLEETSYSPAGEEKNRARRKKNISILRNTLFSWMFVTYLLIASAVFYLDEAYGVTSISQAENKEKEIKEKVEWLFRDINKLYYEESAGPDLPHFLTYIPYSPDSLSSYYTVDLIDKCLLRELSGLGVTALPYVAEKIEYGNNFYCKRAALKAAGEIIASLSKESRGAMQGPVIGDIYLRLEKLIRQEENKKIRTLSIWTLARINFSLQDSILIKHMIILFIKDEFKNYNMHPCLIQALKDMSVSWEDGAALVEKEIFPIIRDELENYNMHPRKDMSDRIKCETIVLIRDEFEDYNVCPSIIQVLKDISVFWEDGSTIIEKEILPMVLGRFRCLANDKNAFLSFAFTNDLMDAAFMLNKDAIIKKVLPELMRLAPAYPYEIFKAIGKIVITFKDDPDIKDIIKEKIFPFAVSHLSEVKGYDLSAIEALVTIALAMPYEPFVRETIVPLTIKTAVARMEDADNNDLGLSFAVTMLKNISIALLREKDEPIVKERIVPVLIDFLKRTRAVDVPETVIEALTEVSFALRDEALVREIIAPSLFNLLKIEGIITLGGNSTKSIMKLLAKMNNLSLEKEALVVLKKEMNEELGLWCYYNMRHAVEMSGGLFGLIANTSFADIKKEARELYLGYWDIAKVENGFFDEIFLDFFQGEFPDIDITIMKKVIIPWLIKKVYRDNFDARNLRKSQEFLGDIWVFYKDIPEMSEILRKMNQFLWDGLAVEGINPYLDHEEGDSGNSPLEPASSSPAGTRRWDLSGMRMTMLPVNNNTGCYRQSNEKAKDYKQKVCSLHYLSPWSIASPVISRARNDSNPAISRPILKPEIKGPMINVATHILDMSSRVLERFSSWRLVNFIGLNISKYRYIVNESIGLTSARPLISIVERLSGDSSSPVEEIYPPDYIGYIWELYKLGDSKRFRSALRQRGIEPQMLILKLKAKTSDYLSQKVSNCVFWEYPRSSQRRVFYNDTLDFVVGFEYSPYDLSPVFGFPEYFRIAYEKGGSLVGRVFYIENVELRYIDILGKEKQIDVPYLFVQEKLTELGKAIEMADVSLAQNLHIQLIEVNKRMWSRGFMNWDMKLSVNYGLTKNSKVVLLDTGGIIAEKREPIISWYLPYFQGIEKVDYLKVFSIQEISNMWGTDLEGIARSTFINDDLEPVLKGIIKDELGLALKEHPELSQGGVKGAESPLVAYGCCVRTGAKTREMAGWNNFMEALGFNAGGDYPAVNEIYVRTSQAKRVVLFSNFRLIYCRGPP